MALSPEDRESSTRRAEAAPDFYQVYLNSPGWRTTRNAALARAKWTCHRCGAKRDLNVHHRSYERLGAETASDLEVLCFSCHREHHVQEATTPTNPLGIYLKIASEVLDQNFHRTIADISDAVKTLCAQRHIEVDPKRIAKAISLTVGSRMKDGGKPYRSVVEVDDDDPMDERQLTHAQAVEFLTRIGCGGRAPAEVVKPMPKAKIVTQRQADRLRAFEMIATAMQESIARCEALEQTATKPKGMR